MDHKKHYNTLIAHGLSSRTKIGITERHHIIPKCVGGTDCSENIVLLTPREHFIAHQLLIFIYPECPRLVYAARMMCFDRFGNRVNNRMYDWLKKKYRIVHSAKRGPYGPETKPRKPRKKETKPRTPRVIAQSHKDKIKAAMAARSAAGLHNLPRNQIPWNKGLTLPPQSEETKKKRSMSLMGNTNAKKKS